MVEGDEEAVVDVEEVWMVVFTQPSHLCEVRNQGDGNTFRLWVNISLLSACRADIACVKLFHGQLQFALIFSSFNMNWQTVHNGWQSLTGPCLQ